MSTETSALKLNGKTRKIGGEAPAIRITKMDGSQNVIGMAAAVFQCIITSPDITSPDFIKVLNDLNTRLKGLENIQGTVVTPQSKESVETVTQAQSLENIEFVIDSNSEFGKKFGIEIAEGEYEKMPAHAMFLIDKDGEFALMEIAETPFGTLDMDAFFAEIPTLIKEKKKKHTHEDWMRA